VWYKDRFGVDLDSKTEVVALIGSKEGIAHLPLALLNLGDEVLVPDPGYPVYTQATILAGGNPKPFPLTWEGGFLPEIETLDSLASQKTKLLYISYPNNPTAAVASVGLFEDLASWAKSKGIVVAHDAAYSEVFQDHPTPSYLQAHGAKEVGVEFHSLSKTFSMTGWRIGFCVGHADVIRALVQVKSNIDSGVFEAIQRAGIVALRNAKHASRAIASVYAQRRKQSLGRLKAAGIEVFPSEATFYLWCRVPSGSDSRSFAKRILEEFQVVITPGVGFGDMGEGYFRISLTAPDETIAAGIDRIIKAF
jgi:LL-diaminopimelate aminotransferase